MRSIVHDEITQLKQMIAELEAKLAAQDQIIAKQRELLAKFEHYIRGLLRDRFGRKAERILGITHPDQTLIDGVAEFLAAQAAAPATPEAAPVAQPAAEAPTAIDSAAVEPAAKPRGKRKPPTERFPELAVRTEVADLPADQRIDADGQPMVRCGTHVSETIVHRAAETFIQRTIYPRYRSAAVIDAAGKPETAGVPVPERIVDQGMLADETVVQIAVGKFADAMPCNRTLEIMARSGCRLSGSVVDTAMAAMGDLLAPVAARIRGDLLRSPVVGADAAMMRCRDSDRPGTCRRTPIYTVTDGRQAWYRWAPDEDHEHATEVIDGFHRWIITDAWSGWPKATSIGARLAGCWAHARRPFARIQEADPDADRMVRLIGELYAIERQADDVGIVGDARRQLRQRLSAPVVERIRLFAAHITAQHPGDRAHPTRRGATYIHRQWYDLVRFLDHAELRLDNNLAEGDLRMVALIRKNSLYLGAASAGPRFANCLSVIRSCRLARINPTSYLHAVVPDLIRHRRATAAGLDADHLVPATPLAWAADHQQVSVRAG